MQLSNDSVHHSIHNTRVMYAVRALTYLVSYLLIHSWLGRIKPAISPKRLRIERKLQLTAYIKSYTGFWLAPKCMTLNDFCARIKVIDSWNAAKIAKSNQKSNQDLYSAICSRGFRGAWRMDYVRAGFSWWGAWGPAIGVGDGRGALPCPLPPHQKNPRKPFFGQT